MSFPSDAHVVEEMWTRYVGLELGGQRVQALEALESFIPALLNCGLEYADSWSLRLAERIVDHGEAQQVRFPLLRCVVGPALVRGVLSRKAGCARWLSHFTPELWRTRLGDRLPEGLRSEEGLLREALEVDGRDCHALSELVRRTAHYLQYTLHELPTGVLYGHDGASSAQCEELLEQLSEFDRLRGLLPDGCRYDALARVCAYHYAAYRAYRTAEQGTDGYEQFLRRRSRPR